jgi:hypothetical protein
VVKRTKEEIELQIAWVDEKLDYLRGHIEKCRLEQQESRNVIRSLRRSLAKLK